MSDTPREEAPTNSLPDWSECCLRVDNSIYLAKSVAEGGYGDSDAPQATELHRFIYEYDDADPYRSAWFLHRLELLLKETRADLEKQISEKNKEIERMRPVVDIAIGVAYGSCDARSLKDVVRRYQSANTDTRGTENG